MPGYAALLRGVNVGGRNKVAMGELRALLAGLGFAEVATYIQSGNAVFTTEATPIADLQGAIERAITGAFGLQVPVVVRSADQLAAVAASNPFVASGRDVGALAVGFLAGMPDPARVRGLLADPLLAPVAGGDGLLMLGQEVYLHYPNGFARTKLTNALIDRRLVTVTTIRNWRTVAALVEMTAGLGDSRS